MDRLPIRLLVYGKREARNSLLAELEADTGRFAIEYAVTCDQAWQQWQEVKQAYHLLLVDESSGGGEEREVVFELIKRVKAYTPDAEVIWLGNEKLPIDSNALARLLSRAAAPMLLEEEARQRYLSSGC